MSIHTYLMLVAYLLGIIVIATGAVATFPFFVLMGVAIIVTASVWRIVVEY